MTRSLGDSPFHKDDAVSAVPMLRHCRLTPKTKYAIVASDGIWDHLTDQKVAELAAIPPPPPLSPSHRSTASPRPHS